MAIGVRVACLTNVLSGENAGGKGGYMSTNISLDQSQPRSFTVVKDSQVGLVRVDTALLSLRSSGHDPCSAIGEVVDNSLQANANNIRIHLFTDKKLVGKGSRRTTVVERAAVGDDGVGMEKEVLHRSLQLGYSTRYNDRTGMGRFGVGAKLGGISQAKRIDIFSRQSGNQPWSWTYIDLDEISEESMGSIPEPQPVDLPEDCKDLVGESSGTLVVWSKADRLQEKDSGGARSADSVQSDLVNYIARTFRKFLDAGIKIHVNETLVKPHDPLFLMTSTRFHESPDPDPTATVLVNEDFDWPVPSDTGRSVKVGVTMTLLPEKFRPHRGAGGEKMAKERRIDENRDGCSILRADREIFFGILRTVQPSPVLDIDRWVGIEISFPPDLDECFAVRNVKKGAEPINGLRDKLREIIHKTVMTARSQIQSYWREQDAKRQHEAGVHTEAEDIAAKTKEVSPKPRAGQETPEPERDKKIREAAEILSKKHPEQQKKVEEEIRSRPMTIVPESWPGNELFEIDHLGSTAIVKLNMRHPFYQQVYAQLIEAVEKEAANDVAPEGPSLARLAQVGLDLLILAYARAEGMHLNPTEHYSDLRSYWSIHLKNMVQEWRGQG